MRYLKFLFALLIGRFAAGALAFVVVLLFCVVAGLHPMLALVLAGVAGWQTYRHLRI
jgi:hypothetical protein